MPGRVLVLLAFFIKESLLKIFNIQIINSSCEGILWLSMENKASKEKWNICVCYLPPLNSSRQVDAQKFFDCLLANIFELQNDGKMFICGDFNSRCGDMLDFIQGIDDIEQRLVIDFNVNKYGHMFIDFLLNSNSCILNGRNDDESNDFTCITSRGHSVVDYCIVSQDDVSLFSEFKVTRATETINLVGHESILASAAFPDHSVLSWKIDMGESSETPLTENRHIHVNTESAQFKANVKNLPPDFMCSVEVVTQLLDTVFKLESSMRSQNDVDKAYTDLCTIITSEMIDKLETKPVRINFSQKNNKRRKVGKPWWSESLTVNWNELCDREKQWLGCKVGPAKSQLKH